MKVVSFSCSPFLEHSEICLKVKVLRYFEIITSTPVEDSEVVGFFPPLRQVLLKLHSSVKMNRPAPVEITYECMRFLITHNPTNSQLTKFTEVSL